MKIFDTTAHASPVSFELSEGQSFVVGRESSCDVVVGADTVSRRHAEIVLHNGKLKVRDLGSSNGTRLDGKPISETDWTDGQVLEIGPSKFATEPGLSDQKTIVTSPQAKGRQAGSGAGVSGGAAAATASSSGQKSGSFITRHWRGEYGLAWTILVNVLALGFVYLLVSINSVSYFAGNLSPSGRQILISIETLVTLALVTWQQVGLVRSILRSKERGASGIARFFAWLVSPLPLLIGFIAFVGWIGAIVRLAEINSPTGADGAPVYTLQVQNNALVFDGEVVWPIVSDFRTTLAANPQVQSLLLRSPGGDVIAARRVNDMLRQRDLTTAVTEYCHSACTIMYAAGKRRAASPNAQIGFHATSIILMDEMMTRIMNALTFRNDRQNANYYLAAGFDPAFVERAVATPSTDILVLPPSELQQLGVVTEIIQQ